MSVFFFLQVGGILAGQTRGNASQELVMKSLKNTIIKDLLEPTYESLVF